MGLWTEAKENPVREHRVATKESRKSMSIEIVPFEFTQIEDKEISRACPAVKFGGYLYVIEFDMGLIKVGRTDNPSRRLAQHAANARGFGISVERAWVSGAHDNFATNESDLIAQVAAIASGRNKSEYFTGITYEQATNIAAALPFNEINIKAHEERVELANQQWQEFMSATWGTTGRNRDFPHSDNPWVEWGSPIADMFYALRQMLEPNEKFTLNGDMKQLWESAASGAGISVEEFQEKNYIDFVELIANLFVKVASQNMKLWAINNGRHDLVQPFKVEGAS